MICSRKQVERLVLIVLCCVGITLKFRCCEGQMITQPPKNVTAALSTNATFSCHASGGHIVWEVAGTQIRDLFNQQSAAQAKIYAPLPTMNYSELIMTATSANNVTRMIECIVGPLSGVGETASSELVRLTVFAEPYPPSNLTILMDDLNLVATWTEPFSLEGEELTYIISITNLDNGVSEEFTINMTRYILQNPIGSRDCSEYEITVFSRNNYSRSDTGVSGRKHIPTEPLLMRSTNIQVNLSLSGGVRTEISFNSADPCPFYPVTSYTFNITERDTNTLTASIRHTSTLPLVVDDSNGLVPDQVYRLVIKAENSVGSTLSEEILIFTTGLQSSTAVMELNRSITVTCSFATGASSIGCQVTILKVDNMQEILLKNINRQSGGSQVMDSLSVEGLTEESTLLVRVADLFGGGGVSRVLFNTTLVINVPSVTTSKPLSLKPSNASSVPTWIIAVSVLIVLIVIIVSLAVFIFICCKIRSVRKAEQLQDNIDLKLNDVYGVSIESANGRVLVPQNSCLDINPKPNEVYELTKQCEQLKSTWPVNGEQSDPNYSYITMEQNVSVYETIPPIHSQPFRNRYLTS